jgi:type III secretion protein J
MTSPRTAPLTLKVFIALVVALLGGCKEDLYAKLTQNDANQMLAVLLENDVEALKSSPDGKTWTIAVPKEDTGRALSALRAAGLPAAEHAKLGDMFKKDGLISTPTEERVRFIYGVSQELSETLSAIDGVVNARVHIVLPNNDPLAAEMRPSSASVFIKYTADANVAPLTMAVKNLVVRSVEGLSYDNVNVTLMASAPSKSQAARPATAKRTPWLVIGLGTLLVVVLAAGAVLGIAVWRPNAIPAKLRKFMPTPVARPA